MKLLPKSKPINYRFIPNHSKIIKVAAAVLLIFNMQSVAAKTEKSIVSTNKNVKKNNPDQKKISGTVTNEKGEALPGVNIVAKGTNFSTQTDFDGKFSIDLPDNITTLIVSYIGLQEQEVTIT